MYFSTVVVISKSPQVLQLICRMFLASTNCDCPGVLHRGHEYGSNMGVSLVVDRGCLDTRCIARCEVANQDPLKCVLELVAFPDSQDFPNDLEVRVRGKNIERVVVRILGLGANDLPRACWVWDALQLLDESLIPHPEEEDCIVVNVLDTQVHQKRVARIEHGLHGWPEAGNYA